MMPGGAPPIALFRLLARHPPLAEAAHAMGRHQLEPQPDASASATGRSLIDRTTARCGAGYELGVHVGDLRRRAPGSRRSR